MSSLEPQFIQDFTHFEQHVAKLIHKADWTVETAKTNQPGYDLVVKKGNLVGVVQVKWLSRLAFDLVGGRCYPREDFINLADYIEREAGIGILRAN
ncbi:hypothetical protein [Nostoc sp.]|uniref:hypothetical protein n=1 Tax=Nostoc sp. TaxID=1180 RepID=UPI002FF246CA